MQNLVQLRKLTLKNLNLDKLKLRRLTQLTQKIPYASILSYRVIWYSASLLMYGWFLGWIAYDFFVWHKPLTEVSMTNYVGSVVAMVLIWAGSILFRNPPPKSVLPQLKKTQKKLEKNTKEKTVKEEKTVTEKVTKKRTRRQSKTASAASPQLEELPANHPEPQLQREIPLVLTPHAETITNSSGCQHYIKNSREIPDACLTCKELIACLSKPKK